MRQLLVINPNTSVNVSALLQAHVQQAAGLHVNVRTVTARFGSPYIADEASYAVASHAALDAWAHALASGDRPPDAVLIGCFGDPGLMALRESSPVPVTGLAEAAFIEAARDVTAIKPVGAYTAGRTRLGEGAARSHSGSLAGPLAARVARSEPRLRGPSEARHTAPRPPPPTSSPPRDGA